MRVIFHIDFNSYFAAVEQQANPRLRGKPIGVTGGDRMKRTVLGAASVEAKKFGVKTGMQIWEAKKMCPQIILIPGDSDKYLEVTKRFLNILKDYSPILEVFSIDECFLELPASLSFWGGASATTPESNEGFWTRSPRRPCQNDKVWKIALEIKQRIRTEIGEWITCSIGISYNKLMAKLAGSLKKPDGLVIIPDQETAIKVLDEIALDEICGIGPRIKKRLNNLGIFDFKALRKTPLEALLASFKSYGQTLYNMARGIDYSAVKPFYEKGEVKSIGHRHTIDHDTDSLLEIKQLLLKLSEMVSRRLRAKNLTGKTIHLWYREAFLPRLHLENHSKFTSEVSISSRPAHTSEVEPFRNESGLDTFSGGSMQVTITCTNDGLEIFKAAWKIFHQIWTKEKIRMIGISISNLNPILPQTLSLLPETTRQETILKVLDKVNDKFGEFTLQRGILLGSSSIRRKPNPFLSDRRFKI